MAVCQFDAAQVIWNEGADTANEKIAEYAHAVIDGKPNFHINFIMNVSPNCDCWDSNDVPIVPDLGIMASFDPVALDKASIDAVNAAPVTGGSILDERVCEGKDHEHNHGDKINHIHPNTDWRVGLTYAEEIGLGTQDYELVVVK